MEIKTFYPPNVRTTRHKQTGNSFTYIESSNVACGVFSVLVEDESGAIYWKKSSRYATSMDAWVKSNHEKQKEGARLKLWAVDGSRLLDFEFKLVE